MTTPAASSQRSLPLIVLAFACIYLVWGSTFLVIRIALDSLPPFFIGAVRNLIAGGLLFCWVLHKRRAWLPRKSFIFAVISGVLLGAVGNGFLILAEIKIPTGTASLWIATVPIWFLILNWLFFERKPPPILAGIGSVLGCVGIALLPSATDLANPEADDWLYWGALLTSAIGWSLGSLLQRRFIVGVPALTVSAVQMLAGGLFMAVGSLATGEVGRLVRGETVITSEGLLAIAYLIVFGSIVAFTAYSWLLGVVEPQKVATYALVNPILAVALGSLIAKEPLSPEVLIAALLVLTSVGLILRGRVGKAQTPRSRELSEKRCI